jgi:hypothetical protein
MRKNTKEPLKMRSANPCQSGYTEEAIVSELERAISSAAAALTREETGARQKLNEAADSSYRMALQLMIQAPPKGRPSSILEYLDHLEGLLRELESPCALTR